MQPASTRSQKNLYAHAFMECKHSSEINMASNSTKKTLQFTQNPEMIDNLIQCLQNYKTMMCIDKTCIYSIGTKEDEHFLVQRNYAKCC